MARSSCCSKFKAELFHSSFFGIDEPTSHNKNGSGRQQQLDLEKSFWTGKYCGSSLMTSTIKLIIWGIVVSTFVVGFIVGEYPYWFMAYVSNWTSVYFIIYMTLSLALSFLARPPIYMIRAAWAMYTISTSHGLVVVLLFWPPRILNPEHYPEMSYARIMAHGITCLLVIFDGLVINHVPVRIKHCVFVILLVLAYIVWSILQAVLEIDNPMVPGPGEPIYFLLDWWNSPGQAAMISAVVAFIIMPISTTLIWALSLLRRRSYLSKEEEKDGETSGDSTRRTYQRLESSSSSSSSVEEEGSVVQKDKEKVDEDEEEIVFLYPTEEMTVGPDCGTCTSGGSSELLLGRFLDMKEEEEYYFRDPLTLLREEEEEEEPQSVDDVVLLDIEANGGIARKMMVDDGERIIHV